MKRNLSFLLLAATTVLSACGKDEILDFRNAQFANGKVYAGNANTPFSGKVTNIPENDLLGKHDGFKKITEIVGKVVLPQLANMREGLGISSASMLLAGALCDVEVKDGMPDGKTTCKAPRSDNVLLEMKFNKSALVGDMSIYSPQAPGKLISQASFKDGQPNGKQEIYGPDSHKLVHTLVWKNGVLDGPEEGFDEATGKKILVATLSNGKYEGPLTRYAPDGERVIARGSYVKGEPTGVHELFNPETGKLSSHQEYVDGKLHGKVQEWNATGTLVSEKTYNNGAITSTSATSAASVDACVDSWVAAFRKVQGDEAMIAQDQIGEWTDWCKQGKLPH